MYPEDYKESIAFHGHSCPGLAIGYRAVKTAMGKADFRKAEDEELIAIVENKSCSVDAVQFLLGCTFGKGNLIFKDHGKQVFTFAGRTSGRAVRVSLRPGSLDAPKGLSEGDEQERRKRMVEKILSMPEEELFTVENLMMDLPGKAQIRASVTCDLCGEPTMETRIVEREGKVYCIPCANRLSEKGG